MYRNSLQVLGRNLVAVSTKQSAFLGTSAPVQQKAPAGKDPIQDLFLTKVREYSQKQKALGGAGKLVDATPDTQKELQADLDRLSNIYQLKSVEEASSFPAVKFSDPKIDPINQAEAKK